MNHATTVTCPQCGALPGHGCTGLSGQRLSYPHGARLNVATKPRKELPQAELDRQEAACRAFLANPNFRADDFWAVAV